MPLDRTALAPVLEHTTFREKHILYAGNDAVFHLNIDSVVAQDLATLRVGSYVDVDLAPVGIVDADRLVMLSSLSRALMERYGLRPLNMTKAYRSALLTGQLAH